MSNDNVYSDPAVRRAVRDEVARMQQLVDEHIFGSVEVIEDDADPALTQEDRS